MDLEKQVHSSAPGYPVLTRLEVDGFKNLIDFSVDFGPFNCIAGPNGVGKSNVLDAIRFLSLLADNTLMEAALSVRGTDPETSDLRDLFWTDGAERASSFRISAEMIVDPVVSDDFGRPAIASSTFLRYEVQIGYEAPTHRGTLGRLVLLAEKLDYITEGEAARKLHFGHSARLFRRAVVTNSRRSKAGYISVNRADDGQIEILVHQDGGSSGQPQKAPASSAPRTIVSTSNTSATPTILAARREMQSWRFLALEPSAMRQVDRFHTPSIITENGGNLPATLYRLATGRHGSDGADPAMIYARITSRLARLAPVVEIGIDVDEVRQLLTLTVQETSGARLPAGSLSDGTLRFLTLCILAEDQTATGLVCMEEPENGIHPAKILAMVELLRDLAVDPDQAPGPENPFRQVIVATHSPAFVQLQNRDDLLFAVETKVKGSAGSLRTVRCRPLTGTWRTSLNEPGIGMGTILAYLTTPPGAQLELPVGEAFRLSA